MSQTHPLTDIADDILPWLAGEPPAPLLQTIVRQALTELCAETGIWKLMPDPITVSPGVSTYELSPEAGAVVSKVLQVEIGGDMIHARTIEWLNENIRGWMSERSTPKYYTQVNSHELILAPVPSTRVQLGLNVVATMQPARSATTIPAWLYDRYEADIQHGVLSKLMLMPDKAWTDLANGEDRRNQWLDALGSIKAHAATVFGQAPLRVTSHN